MLLLGDCGQDCDYSVFKHSCAVQVLLGETFPRYAVAVEPLQVFERLQGALAAKAVESPEEHYIEVLQSGILEHLHKRCPLRLGSAHAIGVLGVVPALALAILDKL